MKYCEEQAAFCSTDIFSEENRGDRTEVAGSNGGGSGKANLKARERQCSRKE